MTTTPLPDRELLRLRLYINDLPLETSLEVDLIEHIQTYIAHHDQEMVAKVLAALPKKHAHNDTCTVRRSEMWIEAHDREANGYNTAVAQATDGIRQVYGLGNEGDDGE